MTEVEEKRTVRVTAIQRFSLHDGPGIRTTVFLKGCSLRCSWCANPENMRYEIEPWQKTNGETGNFGFDVTLADLKRELLKDRAFYLDGGGVTFSGGEPLLQICTLEPLLSDLKQEKIHLAIETALFVDFGFVETAVRYIDWWYVDMKTLVPEVCCQELGGNVGQYLKNLTWLAKKGVPLCIRIPCVHRITDTSENLALVVRLLQELGLTQIEIFGVHDLAKSKYQSLCRPWTMDVTKSEKAVQSVGRSLQTHGLAYRLIHL